MKPVQLLIVLFLTTSGPLHADGHPACSDPDYPYHARTSSELRTIAASCKSAPVANLYYNRAYYAELVSEATTLAELIAYYDNSSSVHLEASRLYMTLLEQLAPVWYPDPATRVAFLNREYDHHAEIAALRLKGYDRMADRLERSIVTHQ